LSQLRIGELALRTGRTVHAIRWYETQGLIPGVARDSGGRRLYERLGYAHWGHGRVIDRWTQRNDHGDVVIEHADECFYLTKQIG